MLLAVISQKLFLARDKFVVDIYNIDYEEEVIVIMVALQHMLRDRSFSTSSVGSSSDGEW